MQNLHSSAPFGEYDAPTLFTTEVTRADGLVGIRPDNVSGDAECQCTDCDSDDCGVNGP